VRVGLIAFKPLLVIPVYNGRDSLLRLTRTLNDITDIPILVVDDGSTDGLTALDIPHLEYLRHDRNRGKGAALKTGLQYGYSSGFSHAITLDADGQHDPALIPEFLKLAESHTPSMVIGTRDLMSVDMPLHRILSNNITSMVLSLRVGKRVLDSQVGYRCYPLMDSRLWISNEPGFQFESAVFFNASKLKIPFEWISIPVIYGAEESHMHLFLDTVRFVRTFMRSFKW